MASSAQAADAIPDMSRRFRVSAARLLASPALPGTSALKDMLAVAGLQPAQQQQVSALYAAHSGDLPGFWTAVSGALGAALAGKLQIHGKLAFLTINNAPLMKALDPLGDPLKLVQQGFHRADKWRPLIAAVPVPPQIPGDTAAAKAANYADFLSAQLRISYPTAAITQMIRAGDLKLDQTDAVTRFLDDRR